MAQSYRVVIGGDDVTSPESAARVLPDRPQYRTQTVQLEQDLLSIIREDGASWHLRFDDGQPVLERES